MSTRSLVFARQALVLALLLCGALAATAQITPPDTCLPQGCKTFTIGGYGGACPGPHPVANPACIRDDYFGSCFPAGLTIGDGFTASFSSAAAVNAYLPAAGGAAAFTQNYTDPATTSAGVFGGQVLALALTVGFSNCGVPGFCAGFSDLRIWTGPFEYFTVGQLLFLANQVIGGNSSGLPLGATLTDLNAAVDSVNKNFDNGTVNLGFLIKPDCQTEHQLAVELLGGLNAIGADGAVSLAWATASERNNSHFDLYRDGNYLARVEGAGTTASRSDYRYADRDLENGHAYSYRLVSVDENGERRELATASATPLATTLIASEFALLQNYPNPFNPTTAITYVLKDAAPVTLTVFDLTGRAVATLVHASKPSGAHTVSFDASRLATGVYLYRLDAGSFSETRKLMLLK